MEWLKTHKKTIAGWIAALAVALGAIAAMTPTDKDDKAAEFIAGIAETLDDPASSDVEKEEVIE